MFIRRHKLRYRNITSAKCFDDFINFLFTKKNSAVVIVLDADAL